MTDCLAVTEEELRRLSKHAAAHDRLRLNLNLHPESADPIQRLCNAFEPGTYVRPHRHEQDERWELFAVLMGRAVVLTFDTEGRVVERITLGVGMDALLVEIPPRTFHTVASLSRETVLFEVKPGPYQASTDKFFAPWAPSEGDTQCVAWVEWYERAEVGQCFAG